MRTRGRAGLLFAGGLVVAGCASSVASTDGDPQSTLSEESAYVTGIGAKVGGDYVSKTGAYPTLSLNAKAQTYSWDTGVRCITTPCPSGEAGSWALYRDYSAHYYLRLHSSTKTVRWFHVVLNKKGTITELDGIWGEAANFVPKPETDPCSVVRCAAGTTCQTVKGAAACVPNPVVGCAAMLCVTGSYCAEDANGQGSCIAYPTCATTKCGGGNYCADRAIVCIKSPCAPTAPSCEACPASGTTINCMPGPGTRPAACGAVASLTANCPGVTVAF